MIKQEHEDIRQALEESLTLPVNRFVIVDNPLGRNKREQQLCLRNKIILCIGGVMKLACANEQGDVQEHEVLPGGGLYVHKNCFVDYRSESSYRCLEIVPSSTRIEVYYHDDLTTAMSKQMLLFLGSSDAKDLQEIYDVTDQLRAFVKEGLEFELSTMVRLLIIKLNKAKNAKVDYQPGHTAFQYFSAYMLERAFFPLKIEDIAKRFQLSRSYTAALIGRMLGVNFQDLLFHLRLEEARRLFRTSNLKVSEVAFLCTYPIPQNFTKAFKKVCGISPKKYSLGSQEKLPSRYLNQLTPFLEVALTTDAPKIFPAVPKQVKASLLYIVNLSKETLSYYRLISSDEEVLMGEVLAGERTFIGAPHHHHLRLVSDKKAESFFLTVPVEACKVYFE